MGAEALLRKASCSPLTRSRDFGGRGREQHLTEGVSYLCLGGARDARRFANDREPLLQGAPPGARARPRRPPAELQPAALQRELSSRRTNTVPRPAAPAPAGRPPGLPGRHLRRLGGRRPRAPAGLPQREDLPQPGAPPPPLLPLTPPPPRGPTARPFAPPFCPRGASLPRRSPREASPRAPAPGLRARQVAAHVLLEEIGGYQGDVRYVLGGWRGWFEQGLPGRAEAGAFERKKDDDTQFP